MLGFCAVKPGSVGSGPHVVSNTLRNLKTMIFSQMNICHRILGQLMVDIPVDYPVKIGVKFIL